MTITERKKALRKRMLVERARMQRSYKERYDQWTCGVLQETMDNHTFQKVHCYLPMGSEINIFPWIEQMLQRDIMVITPKTLPKGQMQHLILTSLDDLEEGVFGTRHPSGDQVFSGQYDLIIVPGLAFDRASFRLGYGGGYYDRFLMHHPQAYKLGISYPFQMMEDIPLEPHDVPLEEVLCNVAL